MTVRLHCADELVMARQAAEDATHYRKDEAAAATDDDRQKNGKEGLAGGGLVSPGQADTFDHDAPDA